MRILLVSSELHPYSKTGGLADMVGALAKSLAAGGHEVGVVTPLYRGLPEKFPDIKPFDWQMEVPLGEAHVRGGVMIHEVSENLRIYFIDHRDFFFRDGLYQVGGRDFPDNAARFIFFAKAAVHLARFLPWQPELVHAHDWQAGLVPMLILDQRLREGWGTAPLSCLTIHNLAYQGIFPKETFELTNLPADYFNPHGAEFYGSLNCLKAAIAHSDVITTVSPRYAREILTEALGCGLDPALRRRQDALVGILNGVDTTEWNPATDLHLRHHFSATRMAGKALEKQDLQRELALPAQPAAPLFGTVTRLADQKGVDIMLAALQEMLPAGFQFVLLGSGDPFFENAFRSLAKSNALQVAAKIGFDNGLSHRIEAGCDFFLMPSRFEPCGLNQMYSQIYGTIPVVRRTGGLDDSVTDALDDPKGADGIKFSDYTSRALAKAIRKALVLYATPGALKRYRRNAMRQDYSWDRTREEYLRTYRRAFSG
ncbi:MAG TPA: glycogen synthase GlgA [Verrucomicrobiae bacterium]|jgi:starch synthase